MTMADFSFRQYFVNHKSVAVWVRDVAHEECEENLAYRRLGFGCSTRRDFFVVPLGVFVLSING